MVEKPRALLLPFLPLSLLHSLFHPPTYTYSRSSQEDQMAIKTADKLLKVNFLCNIPYNVRICRCTCMTGKSMEHAYNIHCTVLHVSYSMIHVMYFLQEAHPTGHASKVKVQQLENYVLLATRSKSNTELALNRFMETAANTVCVSSYLYMYL